jgi:DNA topoisomerase-1
MDLVLVESPTKAKTISRFLGSGFRVEASMGHIRDLPQKKFGIDLKNDFKPDYVIPDKAQKIAKLLKKLSKESKKVILATDEDREGESISWHLAQILNLKDPKRIVFHEITKSAIDQALKNPRSIDMNLVNAQQARRILDRIVGYKLSPFLWKKIAQGLSAGRVQSVAVRLVAELEEEIKNFKPEEYWGIIAKLQKMTDNAVFEAALTKKDGKAITKLGIKTKDEAEKIVKDLQESDYKVVSVEKKETKKNPLPPFTTSTMQQEAWQKLHFSAKYTMSLAQQLYEKGLSTYHRTDSLNLSELSLEAAKKYILKNFGKDYWPNFSRHYKTKSKSAQEAHEAIRPTDPFVDPFSANSIKDGFTEPAVKLYDLIWRRFLASQMSEAILDSTVIDIAAEHKLQKTKYTLRAAGQMLKFDGFLKVYPSKTEEIELPLLAKDDSLKLLELLPSQHFTQPPSRYSEATLIKTLEKFGIGRPSTYAPILETIQLRNYVGKDEKKLFYPTDIGGLVNNLLVKHFPEIVDIDFTAKMEENLDQISQGKKTWLPIIKDFYGPFKERLKIKEKEVSKKELMESFSRSQEIKEVCPLCQSPLVMKISRFGKFLACSRFPECKYKKNSVVSLGIACPKCQKAASKEASLAPSERGELVVRFTRKRKIFYGCSRWPDCDFALWDKPTGQTCQICSSLIVKTRWRKEKCSNPACQSNAKINAP